MITQNYLKFLLNYDCKTGIFTWLLKKTNSIRIGDVAGRTDEKGYIRISIDNKLYRAHRLAVLYMTGHWPTTDIDHINMNKADNSWTNLRAATCTENKRNQKVYSNNELRIKCVGLDKVLGTYRARIRVNGKLLCLGRYRNKEDAVKAYAAAAYKYFGEFARIE